MENLSIFSNLVVFQNWIWKWKFEALILDSEKAKNTSNIYHNACGLLCYNWPRYPPSFVFYVDVSWTHRVYDNDMYSAIPVNIIEVSSRICSRCPRWKSREPTVPLSTTLSCWQPLAARSPFTLAKRTRRSRSRFHLVQQQVTESTWTRGLDSAPGLFQWYTEPGASSGGSWIRQTFFCVYTVRSICFSGDRLWCDCAGVPMSPYSRYRPLPGSDGISVLQTPPACKQSPQASACRFLRWISKLGPQSVNKQTVTIGGFYVRFSEYISRLTDAGAEGGL